MTYRPTCRVCHTWIPALLDAETAGLPETLAKHAEDCAECRQYLAAAAWLGTALKQWPEPEPAQSPRLIADKVLADRNDRHAERLRTWLAASLTLAVLVLACLVSHDEPISRTPISEIAEETTSGPANTHLAALPNQLHKLLPRTRPAVSLANSPESKGESASETSASAIYSVQEVAYWFLPESVRDSVEEVFGLVAPSLAMSSQSESPATFLEFAPSIWPSIEHFWDPIWEASGSGLRLFRHLVPPIPVQPNS